MAQTHRRFPGLGTEAGRAAGQLTAEGAEMVTQDDPRFPTALKLIPYSCCPFCTSKGP